MSDNPGKIVIIYQFSELFATAWKKAMTSQNITSSFRATGVFPVNHDQQALEILQEKKSPPKLSMSAIAKSTGIDFLPLYSPKKSLSNNNETAQFTDEEMKHFQKCFGEGYDLPGDTRYSQWLKMYHPECNTPHHVIPSNTTSSVNSTDINPPTASLNASGKDSIALDQQEGTSTQSMAKEGKLHSFLEVSTSLACHSKAETRGAKVLTSHD